MAAVTVTDGACDCARDGSDVLLAECGAAGDGGSGLLARRMRAQANFIEYTPIVLILFALVELAVGGSLWLSIAALVYVLARVSHGFGMDADKPTVWRAVGALVTWLVMVGLAITALTIAYTATRERPVPPALAAQV